MSPLGLQLGDLTAQPRGLLLAQKILVNVQVAAGLRHRHPAFPDQFDRFALNSATELPSLHRPRWGSMKHLISVSIKPAAVQW